MSTWVGLLRGINVGKAKRLAMADLRALVEEAGFTGARTLLNSGNVVFDGTRTTAARVARRLEAAIEARAGFAVHVVVLAAEDLEIVVREQTLTQADVPSRLMVTFLQDPSRLDAVRALASRDWTPEAVSIGTRAAYVWCPASVLESPAFEAVSVGLGTHITTRNWATVQKLHAMLQPRD